MPCHIVRLPDGTTAIVKMAAKRPKKCSVCGRQTKEYRLCDGRVGGAKTCDAVLCKACTTPGPNDTDFCPTHAGGKLKL